MLITDDPNVIQEAMTNYSSEFQFITLDIARRNGGFDHGWVKRYERKQILSASSAIHMTINTQSAGKTAVAVGVFAELWIGSKADMFIGTFSSNFGRLLFELIIVDKGGIIPPFISLDRPWLPRPP